MRIHKLQTTDAFVAIDLAGAEAASGPIRWAKKILQGGAKDLARTQTYTYAALGMRHSGASGGISAPPENRGDAIAAFIEEGSALVAERTYLPDAAKGIGAAELAALRRDDPRDLTRDESLLRRCDGQSIAVAAHQAVGLEGKTVAIEGFDETGMWIADAVAGRGGRVIALSTTAGSTRDRDGFALSELRDAHAEHGDDVVTAIGTHGAAAGVFDAGADVVFAGSRVGVIDHVVARRLAECAAVVPNGRLPLTARALAELRKAGVETPADFVALAGRTIVAWGDAERTDDEVLADLRRSVGGLCNEVAGHEDGLFLGACYHAEAFLSSWQDELPFGRPLAA
ncbi:MAG: hypothetical protein AAGC53_23005 [Actinomycetota bacterium]